MFATQLALAMRHGLPALVHTPHRDKQRGTRRALDVVKDHLNEVTVEMVADSGGWMGFSIYPTTRRSPPRMACLQRRYGQSGRLEVSAMAPAEAAYSGNSIVRGGS